MTALPTPSVDEELRFGPYCLRPAQQMLYEGAKRVRLGSRAFELLVALLKTPGELVSKERLLAHGWPNLHVDETALRVHVAALRKALGPGPQGAPYIVNVVGRGYRFSSPVTRVVHQAEGTVPPSAATHPTSILRAVGNVVGREDAIGSIVRQLPQYRLVTIVGAGGIGKTTVALLVAERLAATYANLVHVVDLSPLASDDAVPAAVAFGLGLTTLAGDPSARIATHLQDRQLLLVLDCCERVIEGAAILVERIMEAAPGVHILVTSREPLRARGERVLRLPPLLAPPTSAGLTAALAATFPAVQLFLDRASASLAEFALTDANAPLVAALCIRLDGIALAIELVAGRVNAFDLETLVAMLDDRLSVLGPSRRTAVPRHKTLRAVLDWSFDTIADRERRLLRRLAVFVGGAELRSVQDVVASEDLSPAGIVEALATLVDKSLVTADMTGAAARYRLLDTTRAYAAEKLSESGEADAMAGPHARHYQMAFATARATWTAGTVDAWLAGYARNLDDVRGALRWAFSATGDAQLGTELAAEALPVMYELSLVEECRHWAAVALAALRSVAAPDPMLEMRISITLAAALMYNPGPLPQTVRAWERVLEIATDAGFRPGQARALWGLWTASTYGGRPREALGYAQRHAAVKIDDEDTITHLPSERIIGVALHLMGDQLAARARLEGMLAKYVFQRPGYYTPGFQLDQGAMARVTLVRVLWVMGQADDALAMLNEVLREVRRANHAISVCYAIIEAAIPILLMAGDPHAAARELELLQRLADQNGFAIWQAGAQAMHVAIRSARGEAVAAHDVLEAFSALRATGYTAPAAWLAGFLADARATQESLDAHAERVASAIVDGERFGELWHMPELLRVQATLTVLARPDAACEARDLLARAANLAHEQGAETWERRIKATMAGLG